MHEGVMDLIEKHKLNDKEIYYPITDDTFNKIAEKCKNYIMDFEISNIDIEEITLTNKNIDYFDKFVSNIATMLVLLCGLKNNTVYTIKFRDLDLDKNTITINGFNVYLPNMLNKGFYKYIELRDLILRATNNYEEESLFINRNGNAAINNTFIFKVLMDVLDNYQLKTLSKYIIIKLLDNNVNYIQIKKLTGYKEDTINHCIEIMGNKTEKYDICSEIRYLDTYRKL